ncbi:unnamed protein product [Pylaiella littoralis]
MSVSPQLLALMAVTPTRSNGATCWSIFMDFRYPFPWEVTAAFVLRAKAKGPPDDMVTLEVDRNVFKYDVRMPWYARFILGKNIIWHDVLHADPATKMLSEDGMNMNLLRMGTVRDCSSWRACNDDPNVTLYSKRVDFEIRMPVGPTIMMQVAQPLMQWFRTKSHLCRELEVQSIRDFLVSEKGDTQQERAKRIADDTAWMAALTAETPATSSSTPASSSCSSPPCCSEDDRRDSADEEEEEESHVQVSSPCCSSPSTNNKPSTRTRLAAGWAKVKHLTARAREKLANAAGSSAVAERRPRPHTATAATATETSTDRFDSV